MAYDLAPLGSYVRFYHTVVLQLESVYEALARAHGQSKAQLTVFSKSFGPVDSPALAALTSEGPKPPATLATLWRPKDPQGLSGMTDVYEVVGRFTFQGDDDQNLSRVQALVAAARNDIHGLRSQLSDVAQLPELARTAAVKLATDETRTHEQRRNDRLSAFGPLAQTLALRAKQTVDAVRGVPVPDLTDVETAADEYRKYVTKVDQVYQTCLPFLRKSVQNLFSFVGADSPPSWPDSLPLVREMPPELLTVPPSDSPELQQARGGLFNLDEEEIQLGRMRDEIAANITRLEAEVTSLQSRDAELKGEVASATAVAEYAVALDQLETTKRSIIALEQQKAQRLQLVGDLWQRHQQVQQAIDAIGDELNNRAQELAVLDQELNDLRQREPVLFGKEEWRSRISSLENDIDSGRVAYTQRIGVLNQLKIDLSAVSVQVQTEQTQSGLIDRWITEAKAKVAALEKQTKEMEGRLGQGKPGRPLTAAEGQEMLAQANLRRAEAAERVERLRAEIRRRKEEGQQVAARFKQIETERSRVKGMVDSAQVAATQGRDAALRQLAMQRRSAVDKHVTEVLGGLEKSLAAVDAVFIDPAREAMMRSDEPRESLASQVREAADKLTPVIEQLTKALEPELLAQDAVLSQVQREFCDVAAEACRKAWA